MKSFLKFLRRILTAGAVFYLLDRFANVPTAFSSYWFTFSYPFLTCIAVIHGPLAGAGSGLVGYLLSVLIDHIAFQWIDAGTLVLYCLLVGISGSKRMDFVDGVLDSTDIAQYVKSQIFSNLLVWFLLRPILMHFVLETPLFVGFAAGFLLAINRMVSGMMIGTILLEIYTGTRYSEAAFYRS